MMQTPRDPRKNEGFADTNLVIAAIDPHDALHPRALRHLRSVGRLKVPFSVGIEILLVARKRGIGYGRILDAVDARFEIEERDVLLTAADAMDEGDVATPFDAVHLAHAFHRGGRLHTADDRLLQGPYPTRGF